MNILLILLVHADKWLNVVPGIAPLCIYAISAYLTVSKCGNRIILPTLSFHPTWNEGNFERNNNIHKHHQPHID